MDNKEILDIPGNKENIRLLTLQKKDLVPFIGAGFSMPACPSWGHFLETFFKAVKGEFLQPEDETRYLQLKEENRFEEMAGFLVDKAKRRKFEEAMKTEFDKPLTTGMKPKFQLLHQAFPGLKITTNFDCLVENNCMGSNVMICYGSQPGESDRSVTKWEQNTLLKIHGGLRDIHSIVLTSTQYADIYGDPENFDPDAPLPRFLTRVFTNKSLLFIGCSLAHDRTMKIMKSLLHMRPHFALMLRPGNQRERVELNRRLADLYITPIWITDFSQIEKILQSLVKTGLKPSIGHGVPFVGREPQLSQMRENFESGSGGVQTITGRFFSIQGAGGVGKTTLAIEAARRFGGMFKDGVLPPIRVDEHTPMSFAVYLAGQFGEPVTEPPDEVSAQAQVTALLEDRHALVILDNAVDWKNLRYMLPGETRSSILVTTRGRDMCRHIRQGFSELEVREIRLETFTPAEALALFRRMLGGDYETGEEETYLSVSENLGFLPIALRQAISLMLFGPHYTASRLLEKLRAEDRLGLLRKGTAVEESDCRTLETVFDLSSTILTPELIETLEYLAICGVGPVPLDFLGRLSGKEEMEERLERLFTFSWCERRERDGKRYYELHQLVRELVRGRFGSRFGEAFIGLVHEIFRDKSVHFSEKEELYVQLEEAFLLAKEAKDKRLIKWMYSHDLYYFCTYRGFANFYVRLTRVVEELFPDDKWALRTSYAHRALIFSNWGKLDEAMDFHKKEEEIEEELGDRAGLAGSYGNQAGILQGRGKLDEAMTLHKKEEKIYNELGDRAHLATSYGNQALILNAWGKLDEAMTLHKKQEEVCNELGDRAGLAISYDNQAVILRKWGKLKEAMTLHKKEEKIFEQLGMRTNLAECYGNQAVILRDWNKLEEAMDLHKTEESMCRELKSREQLARSLWNQGLIHNKKNDFLKQIQLWQQSIQINKEIGIPTKEYEEKLAKLKEET